MLANFKHALVLLAVRPEKQECVLGVPVHPPVVARVTNARPLVDPGVKDQLDSPSPVVFDQRQPHIGRLDADTVSKSLQPVQVFSPTKFYSIG